MAPPALPTVAFRLVHGPSLEADDNVSVLTIEGEGEAKVDGSRIRGTLAEAGIGQVDIESEAPIGRALAIAAEAIAAHIVGTTPRGIRASRLHARGFVLPPLRRDVLRGAVRLAGEVVAAQIGAPQLQTLLASPRAGYVASLPWRDDAAFVIEKEALGLGLPARWSELLPQTFLLGEGRRQVRLFGSYSLRTPAFARYLADDKTWFKSYAEALGLPVLPHAIVRNADDAAFEAANFGFPVVIKPIDGSQSRGVTVDIRSTAEIPAAMESALAAGTAAMVQPYIDAPDYRAFVLDGRLRIAYRRNAPYVVGDGISTIRSLIEEHNANVAAGRPIFPATKPIVVDAHLALTLTKAGRTLDTVLTTGEIATLRAIPLRANGGFMTEVTDQLHPENVALLERALRLSGLMLTGLDFRADAIDRPWTEGRFAIIEINVRPAIMDYEGERIARELVRAFFPDPAMARLPTIVALDDRPIDVDRLAASLRRAGIAAGVSAQGRTLIDGVAAKPAQAGAIADAHAIFAEDTTLDLAVHVASLTAVALHGFGLAEVDLAILPDRPANVVAVAVDRLMRSRARRTLPLPAMLPDDLVLAEAAAVLAGRPLPRHCL